MESISAFYISYDFKNVYDVRDVLTFKKSPYHSCLAVLKNQE